ncbi:hypothetical protein J2D73_09430 [Acetobacter sacchari]|uniref:Lipoprotein n=2 Tax=Acetobacter sacchari TaxID=2661687 RepID=A0ABS3LVR7_9PROT|nr:hypothetical protein [Acetobacter sacchari]
MAGRMRSRALTALILGAASLPLPACGFHPLYETSAGHIDVQEKLKQIYVAGIPDRFGQVLRLALQQQMSGAGPENPTGYTLKANGYVSQESIDIHSDNTSGRVRATGHAHWQLWTVGLAPKFLAEGDATTLDGMNNTFEEYFAQSLNTETLQNRVARTLADIVTQQVAIWFETHAPAPIAQKRRPVYYQMPNAIPNSSQQQPVQGVGEDGLPALATGRNDPNADENDPDMQ